MKKVSFAISIWLHLMKVWHDRFFFFFFTIDLCGSYKYKCELDWVYMCYTLGAIWMCVCVCLSLSACMWTLKICVCVFVCVRLCTSLSTSRSFSFFIHNWMWVCVFAQMWTSHGRSVERWASVDKRFWPVWRTYHIDTRPIRWFYSFYSFFLSLSNC